MHLISSNHQYQVVYSWEKKLALLGQMRYEGSWSSYEAHIYASALEFGGIPTPKEIVIRFVAPQGQLNIWGMALVAVDYETLSKR